jgi:hypothetical protein
MITEAAARPVDITSSVATATSTATVTIPNTVITATAPSVTNGNNIAVVQSLEVCNWLNGGGGKIISRQLW